MTGRRDELDLILRQLRQRTPDAISAGHAYALDETVRLIESLSSVGRYLTWFADRLPRLNPDRLLELNELLPEWDEPIHRRLLHVERDRWPAFIRPLVDRLTDEIISADHPLAIMDLGSGSMEIERQVISRLLARPEARPATFIAIDESPCAHQHARENLASLAGTVELLEATLDEAMSIAREPADRFRIILCRCGAASIASLPDKGIDVLFHSFMWHHLTLEEQAALGAAISRIGRLVVEYDGYHSRAHLIPLSILTWNHPGFLAATLFSHARFPTKRHLKARHNGSLKFFRNGCYLATH